MKNHNDLLKSIRSRSHAIAMSPWQITVSGVPYAIATDGLRALCVEGDHGFSRLPCSEEYWEKRLASLIRDVPHPTRAVDREALIGAAVACPNRCPDCCGEGFVGPPYRCLLCNGAGEIECDMGHYHDCPDCLGHGRRRHPCMGPGPHDGQAKEQAPIQIDGLTRIIDAQFLRGIIDQLDGPIVAGEEPGRVYLSGLGWTFTIFTLSPIDGPVAIIPATAIGAEK